MPIPKEKRKFALWLRPETLAKIEKLYRDDDCRSRSEFIEKAVLFYAGYLAADDGQEYFPNVIVSTVKGSLDSLENRMASLLFKMAVELSMTLHADRGGRLRALHRMANVVDGRAGRIRGRACLCRRGS